MSIPKAIAATPPEVQPQIILEPDGEAQLHRSAIFAKTFGAYYIPGSQFIRENRIHIAGTEAFIKPEINHNGILILDLNETIRVTRGRNRGQGWKPDPREKVD